ncbi:hybrid sensor histidine kinase/response regulator [Pseudomonas nitroreducens]|uniref:ATP-binding response regulator n=2 Tax=Pseudomonas nitroreducens TaxID=46680 RepID=UPI001FB73EB2|nr:hybrid sensor histidine kinase/response regulator [Pseudomonas nitroreducens]MCJ1881467.1 hybrid sensor histidine kinase/response regulator [Pseudomonas nitroreducens]MCJ1894730.1 hybrid sensor histidine kinase/response regulator [Pseudomonas nitroreducens]
MNLWQRDLSHSPYAERVRAEQFDVLRRNSPFSIIAAYLVAGLTTWVLNGALPLESLLAWFAAQTLLGGARLWLLRRYDQLRDSGAGPRRSWLIQVMITTGLSGLLWGLPAAHWMTVLPPSMQMYVVVVLLGLGTGVMNAYSIVLPLFYLFIVPAFTLPFAALLVLLPDALSKTLGAAALVYAVTIFAFAYRFHATLVDSLLLRFENSELLRKLSIEKEAAERSDQAKTRFLASASHDLRQPTYALGLYLGALKKQPLNEASENLVDHISRALAAQGSLFDALLNISRLDAGIVQPSLQVFSLAELLERIQQECSVQAADKGLNLRVRPGAPFVKSDPALFERILRNLVENAIRYTDHGGVLIGWRRRGRQVRVEVWDSGPGIPEREQQKVFWEFHQLNNPERDRSKGLGLGLAIVQRTARLLDHPLALHSREGHGSAFMISLPRATAVQPRQAEILPPRTVVGSDKLIYVIEDDAENREGLRLLFQSWEYRHVIVADVADLLADPTAAAQKPDLIISDYRLRDHQTGIDAIARLHGHYEDDWIAAVLVTGDTDPQLLAQASAHGWPLLHKPLAAEQLKAMIDEQFSSELEPLDDPL